ncbi:MAG: hypothetical protein KJZ69_09355 [Phycisphaerales bacterium]|nr:hypothetical protein [Phycisphaerales bacterium]
MHFNGLFDSATTKIILAVARWLSRRPAFTAADAPELAQILACHLWLKQPRFDPQRGDWLTFARVVVDRRAKSLLREARAGKRLPDRHLQSLHHTTPVESARPVDLTQSLPHPSCRNEARRRELRLDMRELSRLEPAVRRMLEEAHRTGRKPTLVQFRRLSRRLGDREIERLRLLFEDRGLRDYLG